MLTADDLILLQGLFDKNNTKLRKEIDSDIQTAIEPLSTNLELLEQRIDALTKRESKHYRELNRKLNFITKFFDKEIVDLRKQVAYISEH